MQVIKTIREMQKWSMDRKKAGKTVAVVPTMGFLHEGHLSLIDAARANGADAVVVTIFVNPIQFAPNEDFDSYPRDFEHDAALLREKNVDVVFAPAVSEMYPAPVTCMVIENKLSKGLCAKTAARPTSTESRRLSPSCSMRPCPISRSSGRRTHSRRAF